MKSELLYYGSVGLLGLIYSSVLWLVGAFLAPQQLSELAIFFAVFFFATQLGAFGQPQYIQHIRTVGRDSPKGVLVRIAASVFTVIGASICASAIALLYLINFSGDHPSYLALLGAVALSAAIKLLTYDYVVRGQLLSVAYLNIIRSIGIIVWLFFSLRDQSIGEPVFLFILSESLAVLFALLRASASISIIRARLCSLSFESQLIVDLLSETIQSLNFGYRALWTSFFLETSTKIDILILNIIAPGPLVGFYAIVSNVFETLLTGLVTLRNTRIALVRAIVRKEGTFLFNPRDEQTSLWLKTRSRALLVLFMVCSPLAFASIFPVFKIMSLLLLIVLTPLLVFPLVFFQDNLLILFGKVNELFIVQASCVLLNVLLNFALISLVGIWGAAVATSLAIAAYSLGIRYYTQRELI